MSLEDYNPMQMIWFAEVFSNYGKKGNGCLLRIPRFAGGCWRRGKSSLICKIVFKLWYKKGLMSIKNIQGLLVVGGEGAKLSAVLW